MMRRMIIGAVSVRGGEREPSSEQSSMMSRGMMGMMCPMGLPTPTPEPPE